ncbi:hypothetical protein NMY22_g13928 [Coprinellus aureogranulatus]|nr:hypothetical protein NMY22_g13928 [Coprinellus aureogranulatus]
MATFPDEPLNLSAADGFGYYPTDLNQELSRGKYHIARKLGWGPRSSTWLVSEKEEDHVEYWAVQIWTVAASKGVEKNLLPIFKNEVSRVQDWNSFPNFRESFWEKSVHGDHLCFVMSPYGLPFSKVLLNAQTSGRAGLPVHVVQYVASNVLLALEPSHKEKVMHGGVKLENLVFWPSADSNELPQYLADNPPAETRFIDGLPVVRSQPIDDYEVEWDAPMSDVSNWMLLLAGFGHVQVPPYVPEQGYDYGSAPETLLANASCGPSTDIWMLGCLVFQLLTGKPLFTSASSSAERLSEIRDILQDTIPDSWADDETVKALTLVRTDIPSLKNRLAGVLTSEEASAACTFLRKCLAIDPQRRPSVEDLQVNDGWVDEGAKCSCCYN